MCCITGVKMSIVTSCTALPAKVTAGEYEETQAIGKCSAWPYISRPKEVWKLNDGLGGDDK